LAESSSAINLKVTNQNEEALRYGKEQPQSNVAATMSCEAKTLSSNLEAEILFETAFLFGFARETWKDKVKYVNNQKILQRWL